MNHRDVGVLWEANAAAWTELSRAGFDDYRDAVNTPGFLAMLPDVTGLTGVDLGCGEGHNTRQVAQRGAHMTGIDIAPTFIRAAQAAEVASPLGITYEEASAVTLPFPDASFDFATAFMSFMDIPETECVLAEARRVLKPGGFLQFSILHPCFMPPRRTNRRDAAGRSYAVEVGDYFARIDGRVERWLFSSLPKERRADYRPFAVPRFHRTVSTWLNLVIAAGFVIEAVGEPTPDDATVARVPKMQDAQVVAYFLHVRGRVPRNG